MKAIIMAGGCGTRLLPLTESIPKPLAKLCGKPVCCYILDLLKKHGCDEAIFTLRYKGEMIEDYFSKGDYEGIKLGFSYEQSPLGTAGCVKKAAAAFTEPFLVISGDALCDFNLTAALKYHKDNSAAATIITKRADDPREFGLVNSSNGKVTGFTEKPSFIGCTDNNANTGVYVLSPEILQLIPDDEFSDFACDIFPKMLEQDIPMYAYEDKGYWCDIGDLKAYKRCQRDILEGRVDCRIDARKITDGGYSDSGTGNYRNLRAPYYIGKNVNIGSDTVIRGGAVIGDNVTIGSGCTIDGAVISDGGFIADNVRLCDCIVCPDVSVKSGSAVYENAVLGERATIGKGSIVMPDVKIWSDKQVSDNVTLRSDMEKGARGGFELDENGYTGQTGITATPSVMSMLGAAAAAVSEKTVCVGCRADGRSQVFMQSLIAGINAAGRDCLDCGETAVSMLVHKSRLCDAGLIMYVSVGADTSVEILAEGGIPITRAQERKLEGIMNRGGAPKARFDGFGRHLISHDSGVFYAAMLSRLADFNSGYSIQLDCNNSALKKCISAVFEKISDEKGPRMIISIDHSGTSAEIYTRSTDAVGMERLLLMNYLDLVSQGSDIALPHNVLFDMERICESYGRTAYRYNACTNDNSDSTARAIAQTQPFITDGCVLAINALKYAVRQNMTFEQATEALPRFEREKRYVPLDGVTAPDMLRRLGRESAAISEGVMIEHENGKVLIRSDRRGKGLYLFAQSANAETAAEICDFTEELIGRYGTQRQK
ncbi:MAG: NTP transferase domain-containing protein [Eubacterium sp.]|nr:NTP transferase domain-containing protein [Eubacterium sp.]